MPLKIAISGKGGVGKSTVAAALAMMFAREGWNVIAVDADPASSLPAALGVPEAERESIVPLAEMLDLIEERTGMRPGGGPGGLYSLNPRVDDLADRYAVRCPGGVRLLVLGTIKAPGSGCFCPESSLLKALLNHLVLDDEHVLVLDMEAGLEHLGRSTVQAVDVLLVVVEPGRRSVDTASRIAELAGGLGVKSVFAVLNKISSPQQETELLRLLGDIPLQSVATIPFDERLVRADLSGLAVMDSGAGEVLDAIASLRDSICRRK